MSPIKKARLLAKLTQQAVAKLMNVTQPTFQRWESGSTPVPKEKLEKLAALLNTSSIELLGHSRPFDALGFDPDIPADRTYFGEVAIHFASGNKPLVAPITSHMADLLNQSALWLENAFVVIETLDNRLIVCRRKAITDIFLSEESADQFGPESDDDYEYLGVCPDEAFWRVVEYAENLRSDDALLQEFYKEFGQEFVDSVITETTMSQDQMDHFDRVHQLTEDESRESRSRVKKLEESFNRHALKVVWQLCVGVRREHVVDNEALLYKSLSKLFESPNENHGFLQLISEEERYVAYINTDAIDYLSVPIHKYRDGKLEVLEQQIDAPTNSMANH